MTARGFHGSLIPNAVNGTLGQSHERQRLRDDADARQRRARRARGRRPARSGASRRPSGQGARQEEEGRLCRTRGRKRGALIWRAPRPAGARPGADARQPRRRPRPARDLQVPDRRRRSASGTRELLRAAGAGRRRGDARPGGHARSRCRRCSASRRSARSPTCGAASRRTSRGCRSATSTRPSPAC